MEVILNETEAGAPFAPSHGQALRSLVNFERPNQATLTLVELIWVGLDVGNAPSAFFEYRFASR